jgi:hypothetical protein
MWFDDWGVFLREQERQVRRGCTIEVYRVPLLCKSLALSHLGIWFVRWSSRVFLTKPLLAGLHRGAYF